MPLFYQPQDIDLDIQTNGIRIFRNYASSLKVDVKGLRMGVDSLHISRWELADKILMKPSFHRPIQLNLFFHVICHNLRIPLIQSRS